MGMSDLITLEQIFVIFNDPQRISGKALEALFRQEQNRRRSFSI